MKRLHQIDLNTPAYFDDLWPKEKNPHYDGVRHDAFIAKMKDGDTVCDLGAGYMGWGQYLLECRKDRIPYEVYAMDYSKSAIELTLAVTPSLKYTIGDVRHTGYSSDTFDVVGAGEVIEHMENPEELVKEMARITKPGGWIIISTVNPDCPNAIKHGDYPEHLWQFSTIDLATLFDSYGDSVYDEVGDYQFMFCKKPK